MCNRLQSAGEPDPRTVQADSPYLPMTGNTPKSNYVKLIGDIGNIYPYKSPREYALNLQKTNPEAFNELVRSGKITTYPAPTNIPKLEDYALGTPLQRQPKNKAQIFNTPEYNQDMQEYYTRNPNVDRNKASEMQKVYLALNKKKI